MATTKEYTNEELNYYRICYLTTDIITEGLRTIFKQEWNSHHKATLGEWKDEPGNGLDFKNSESPCKQRQKAHLLATMVNGNRAEWDCTMLFYAILFSDCIGNSLNGTVKSKVDDLRKFRNKDFAHMPHGHLTDAEFQNAISKVDVAFQALGLSTDQIQVIRNQTNFPTEELKNVLKKVEDLKREVEVLEAQLNKEISSFCVLPPKPSHEVADRESEVAGITKQLEELKEANENRLSSLYISGNPGSGKSQLAGLVGKRYFDEVNSIPNSTVFVMTVNAESPSTLLESYISLVRKLKCPEYAVTNTLNSPDLNSDEKIAHLKSLISTKIELYTTWLLIVDNIKSISKIHAYLPESGNEQWARGQLLITTQDTMSVPPTSSFTSHFSVSKGMEPQDAMSLLEKLSGISDGEKDKVAQVLDYQPLALAIAATYVREAQQNRANFGWGDYLHKLEEGQRVATANIFVKTNPTYPKSMTEVLEVAVQEMMGSSDEVIKHTVTLLSFCAAQPLNIEIAVIYIRNVEIDLQDAEGIRMKIQRCPLLLFDEGESGVYIRVHQVTHDAISRLIKGKSHEGELLTIKAILKSLSQFISNAKLTGSKPLYSLVKIIRTLPHLATLYQRLDYLKRNNSTLAEKDIYGIILQSFGGEELGSEHSLAAKLYKALEINHRNLGDLDQAKVYHDHAMVVHPEQLETEDINNYFNNYSTICNIL